MQEQRSGGREIVEALEQMRHMTSQVHDGSSEMKAGNEQMLTAMKNVNDITQSFRDAMNRVTNAVDDVSVAVDEVSHISETNGYQVQDIVDAISRFQLRESDHFTETTLNED
jgi:methyl-accepting chemotaxis protein